MPVITFSSRRPLTRNIAAAQLTGCGLDPDSQAARTIDAIALAVERAVERVSEIAADPSLSHEGKRSRIAAVVQEAEAKLPAFGPDLAQREARLAELRAKASATPPTPGDPMLAELRAREIRDAVRADKRPAAAIYFSAIDARDWQTVAAVENAPSVAPLLSAEERQRGAAMKIEASGLAAEIEATEKAAGAIRATLGTAKREVANLRVGSDSGLPPAA